MMQSMRSQRVVHDLAAEQQHDERQLRDNKRNLGIWNNFPSFTGRSNIQTLVFIARFTT